MSLFGAAVVARSPQWGGDQRLAMTVIKVAKGEGGRINEAKLFCNESVMGTKDWVLLRDLCILYSKQDQDHGNVIYGILDPHAFNEYST